jgi:hypothetical protein
MERKFELGDLIRHKESKDVVEIRTTFDLAFTDLHHEQYILVCKNEMRLDK